MLIISSSAKTLDYKSEFTELLTPTKPLFLKDAAAIRAELAKLNLQDLAKALDCSEKIAATNLERYQEWSTEGGRPALFAYKGDVFRQMEPANYNKEQAQYAQDSLYVMSGLYGPVRAFDLIQPYRLEMRIKLGDRGKLSEFWRAKVTKHFNEEIARKGHRFLLNLASKEYSDAVDREALNCPVIDVDFKESKDGQLRTLGLFAKRARGMMIEYCIQNHVQDPAQLRNFKTGGYEFMGEENGRLLFVR